jgi:hypothetical protein
MKFIALVIFGVIASAQSPALQTINSTDLISSGPSKINSNFSALNSGKVAHFVGSGAPGSIALSIQGDTYLDTVAQKVYTCFSLLCSTSPTWVVGSGGGTSPGGSSNDIQVNVATVFTGGRCTMDSSQNIVCNGGYTAGNGSGVGGRVDMGAGTAPGAPGANTVGWGAPATITTPNRINFPNAVPAAHQLAVFGAPTSNVSTWTFQTVPNCTDTGGQHLNFTQSTDGFSCGTSGGGGSVSMLGPSFLFGTPSYTASGAGSNVSPSGVAHGGMSFLVSPLTTTIKHVNYKVVTAAAGGSGMLIAFYDSTGTTAICVALATGTNVTNTGAHSIAWTSGSGVSGGTCTLTLGTIYQFLMSSDSGTLTVLSYGDASHFAMMNPNATNTAAFDNSNSLSTGTGAGLTFNAPSGVTFTAFSDSANFQPVIFLDAN